MLTTLLAAAVVLGVLIFVHELGHFLAAKAVDIAVPRFSIGLGPKMTGFRWGETEYVISWLPLGGYVKMAGMGEEEVLEGIEGPAEEAAAADEDRPSGTASRVSGEAAGVEEGASGEGEARREGVPVGGYDPERGFESKPLWARFFAVSAGVLMNFLFAAVAFAAIAGVWGVSGDQPPVVADVQEEQLPPSAIDLARLPREVRVESVEGRGVDTFQDLQLRLGSVPSGTATLTLRDGTTVTVPIPGDDSLRSRLVGALQAPSRLAPVLGEVEEDGPADAAGLRSGDRVTAVDGRPVETWQAFAAVVERHPGRELELSVERDGETLKKTVVPERRVLAAEGDSLEYGRVGVGASRGAALATARDQRRGLAGSLAYGVQETWNWTVRTVQILGQLVSGGVDAGTIGGPVRIAEMSGDMARSGMLPLLTFMAILSVNLAILNLLPIPVLDGGWILFLSIEAVRGRALEQETRLRLTQAGLLLVAALMILAIGNDLIQVFGG